MQLCDPTKSTATPPLPQISTHVNPGTRSLKQPKVKKTKNPQKQNKKPNKKPQTPTKKPHQRQNKQKSYKAFIIGKCTSSSIKHNRKLYKSVL